MNAPQQSNPSGTSYVVDILWSVDSVMKEAESYEEAIKYSIMLGNDTDTTAAIAGGLAGLKFGIGEIPARWISQLKEKELIDRLMADFG